MNRTEAISLFRASRLMLSEVRRNNPDLAVLFENSATEARKVVLERAVAGLPMSVATDLRALDLRTVAPGALGAALRERATRLVTDRGTQPGSTPTTPPGSRPGSASEADAAALRDAAELLAELEDPFSDIDAPLADIPMLRPAINLGRFHVLAEAVRLPERMAEDVARTVPSPEAATDEVLAGLVTANTLTAEHARTLGAARVTFLLSDDSEELTRHLSGKKLPELLAMRPSAWEKAITTSSMPVPAGYTAASWASELARRHAALAPSKALQGRLLAALDDTSTELPRIAASWPGFGLKSTDARAAIAQRLDPVRRLRDVYPDVDWLTLDYSSDSSDIRNLELGVRFNVEEQKALLSSLKAQQRVHALTADVDLSTRILEGGYHSALAIALARPKKFAEDTRLAPDEAERVRVAAAEVLGLTTNMALGAYDLDKGLFRRMPVGNVDPGFGGYLAKIPGYSELFGSQAWCECSDCTSILSPAAYFVDLMSFIDEHVRDDLFEVGKYKEHVLDLKVRRPDLWTVPLTCENTDTLVPTLDIVNEILENHVASRTGFKNEELADRAKVEAHVYEGILAKATYVFAFDHPFSVPYEQVGRMLAHAGVGRADVARALGAGAGVRYLALSAGGRAVAFTLKELTREQLEREFRTCPEAQRHGPSTDTDFTTSLYWRYLQREPDARGLDNHTRRLAQGRITREALELEFQRSPEARRRGPCTDHFFTVSLYWRYLGHEPDRNLAHHTNRLIPQLFIEPLSGSAEPVDVPDFLSATGLSRAELDELVGSWFVRGSSELSIRTEKSRPSSVQNDVERIYGLTAEVLDRLHRFARLARAAGLSFPELDLWMHERGLAALDAPAGEQVARLLGVRATLGVDTDETLALAGNLPTKAMLGKRQSLFDRRFNSRPDLGGGMLPAPEQRFIHPQFRPANASVEPLLPRLCAELGVGSDELSRLIEGLRTALSITSDADGFHLTADNISRLYRHIRLAQALKLSTAQLFQLLAFVEGLASPAVGGLDDLERVLEFVATWREGDRSLDAIGMITDGPVLNRVVSMTADEAVARLVAEGEEGFQFSDTVFAAALGLSEAESRAIIAANGARFETASSGWRLRADFSLSAPLELPATIAVGSAELLGVLRTYHLSAILPARLARVLQVDGDKAAGVLALAGLDLEAPELVRAVRGDGDPAALVAGVGTLLRLHALCAASEIDGETLRFMAANRALFGLQSLPELSAGAIWAVDRYMRFTRASSVAPVGSLATPSRADLHTLLATHTSDGFPPDKDVDLALVLRAEKSLVTSVRASIPPAADALATLARLSEAVQLARRLHVSGEILPLLLSDGHADLTRAASALRSGLRLRYPDEAIAAAQLGPIDDAFRAQKRDVLCNYILKHLVFTRGVPWRTRADLYHYFLLDVDMGGCGRTSRLVSAISSVQLYAHRIRMNLEQDGQDGGLHVEPDMIPAEEWSWRQNYRVWQANRKVFLWPENYLEPDLRDDKTEQFEELESTLLQQQIDNQTVLDAYTRYLAGFEEIAKLRIGGAWYESSSSLDRLHLFGATSSDPPVWYYRFVDNLRRSQRSQSEGPRWSRWVKLDVQIPVREVAPVVFQGRLHVFWVELRTKSVSSIVDGDSRFLGYDHTMRLRFTTLRADGTWTVPQEVSLQGWPFFADRARTKPLAAGVIRDFFKFVPSHDEARDDYTLIGPTWERVIMDISGDKLYVTARNHRLQAIVDLYGRQLVPDSQATPAVGGTLVNLPAVRDGEVRGLYVGTVSERRGNENAAAAVLLDERWRKTADHELGTDHDYISNEGLFVRRVGTVPQSAELHAVPRSSGAREDVIIQVGADALLFHGSAAEGASARVLRLGTTLSDRISRELFEEGVDSILSLDFQKSLHEPKLPISITSSTVKAPLVTTGTQGAQALLRGALGTWYQELFLHIPWRIALHLNAQGHYEAAQRWFHYIFNPTATNDSKDKDRVWRYVGFRELKVPTLREMLTDEAAIDAYEEDPFNPHAIARLRPSAYQKHMVMRYVDNLLDWADALFTEFTTESINEATLLYTLAGDILGERPPRLGDCGQAGVSPRDYEHVKPLIDRRSEFLVELQNWTPPRKSDPAPVGKLGVYGPDVAALAIAKDPARKMDARGTTLRGPRSARPRTVGWRDPDARVNKGASSGVEAKARLTAATGRVLGGHSGKYGYSVLRQFSPVFCLPPNKELLAYWDRVDDRLGKIRSCRDINGVPRLPALFSPEIDPRLLVRAKAQGFTLDEVLNTTGGSLPPYRFLYLIEKAKGMAATVASFGSALLSALEKRDAEQLNRLRLMQQQNIAKLTTNLRRWEVQVAEEALSAVRRQIDSATYRLEHFNGMITKGFSESEISQITNTRMASLHLSIAGTLDLVASIMHLIPQAGAPTAMKYGGLELGNSAKSWGDFGRIAAGIRSTIASSAAMEAGFERRAEEWEHQQKLTVYELKYLSRQEQLAELRLAIAQRSLEIHEESVAQVEETFAFYNDKFTGLGLYTWLSTTLQRVYRGAYNNALALARLADEAFRYERGTTDTMIDASYWDASHAGLGAGEQLLLALQSLERRFIETNHRSHEVDQAFSLHQISPAAIVQLRASGACEFDVPELFFDLAYPGHYRRRIKAVRLTIPCITGPYVNISAMLSLVQSQIRSDPSGKLVEFPVRRSVSIATSTAQNDAGVFELSFRDERYMPFEGAGAVSRWRLELPSAFRSFDYGSINDIILSMSYTAEYDGSLREQVQQANSAVERSLLRVLQNKAVSRLFSLKHDFSASFNRLLHSAAGTVVAFEIEDIHFPFFVTGRPLVVVKAVLGLDLAPGADWAGLSLQVDGSALVFSPLLDLGGMPGAALPAAFASSLRGKHSLVVTDGAGLRPTAPLPGDLSALADSAIRDMVLYIEYRARS